MKTTLRLTFGLCLSTLLLFSSLDTSAQNGPNLLSNADFANMSELATRKDGAVVYMWPDDWVLVSDSAGQYHPLWGGNINNPVFNIKVYEYPPDPVLYPTIGSWTGVPAKSTMYQDVTGLVNGNYEFSLSASTGGFTGDSHMYCFATGFGGDSISLEMKDGNASGYTAFALNPIKVTNGKCRVGIYITHGSAGNYTDILNLDFHTIPAPVVMDTIRGANILVNADFANVTDLATNKYGNTWVWPDDWTLVSDSLIWNQYPIFKIWWQDPAGANIPTIGCWTGVPSEGTMYQDVTGLANGLYEFSFDGAASGAGDSKYSAFLTGYGGDSISYLMPVTNKFVAQKVGPVNVSNGKCRVGFHIKNGPAGDWNDLMNLNFHSLKLVPTGVESLSVSKIRLFISNGQLNVRFEEGEILGVDIYNISGQLVSSSKGIKSTSFTKALNTNGIFIVKVNTNKGVMSRKVVNQYGF